MNTINNSYPSNHKKTSKKLRLLYNCFICGCGEYELKELHHIDFNKKNNKIDNLVVLCKSCHSKVHSNKLTLDKNPNYTISGFDVTVAYDNSYIKDWFDSRKPLKLIFNIPSNIANSFRKRYVKGFIKIGSCNYYIGLTYNNVLIGILGFENAKYGKYDLFMKADTTISDIEHSTDLLLYILKTEDVKNKLSEYFNREINTVYSMVFSKYKEINRYRKHGDKINEVQVTGGYNLGYKFELGVIKTIKSAKSLWMQKHKYE